MYLALFIFLLCFSCSDDKSQANPETKIEQHIGNGTELAEDLLWKQDSARKQRELYLEELGLVNVQKIAPMVRIDLKYAGTDNFMKQQLYENLDRVYLQRDVAERIGKAQLLLDTIQPGYHLLIYDGVRPVSVQKKMWEALDTIPVAQRGKFVSNPKNKSLHNFGAAVDLTIIDSTGKILDMGAGYDDPRLIAYPSHEAHFVTTGELSAQQLKNRLLLRRVMQAQKFRQLPSEWWHFNACSRWEAITKYKILEVEPN